MSALTENITPKKKKDETTQENLLKEAGILSPLDGIS